MPDAKRTRTYLQRVLDGHARTKARSKILYITEIETMLHRIRLRTRVLSDSPCGMSYTDNQSMTHGVFQMAGSRHYDTVAFDVRDDASMLFFASTSSGGDISDYLLVMRAEGEEFDDAVYLELNDQQLAGHDLLREARLTDNMLTLELREPADVLDGASEIVLTFDATDENRTNVEAGLFRVLGELLTGGNA